jgi:hypothetical protein
MRKLREQPLVDLLQEAHAIGSGPPLACLVNTSPSAILEALPMELLPL